MSRDRDSGKPQQPDKRSGARWEEISEGQDGQRVDNFLMAQLKGVPRARVYRMLRKGEVRINGKRCRPADRLKMGDQVRIPPAETRTSSAPGKVPEGVRKSLVGRFLYEDDELAVLDKPSGIAVHAGSGTPYGVIEALAAARPGVEWGLAHRLDRGTSGCLVVGKNGRATRNLQAAFRENRVAKVYLSLMLGRWEQGEYTVDAPLRRGPERGGQRPMMVDPGQGQEAITRFVALRPFVGYTLFRAEPKTGRTHQIRAHASHWGHPIAGDPLYGDREANRLLKGLGLDSIFLHSAEITIPHPVSGESLHVRAPLPDALKTLLERLPA
ncbi:RluA family pseudouridine synthase [Thiohalorhabdus methylotrophus]|uniref:Pseudouridine synthase n=1 Tax=Thiohalorhabdus methylotrophus TaxID=3242694 RepID=A0ABV4TZW7_9GAMM